jgi:hypothetical protein
MRRAVENQDGIDGVDWHAWFTACFALALCEERICDAFQVHVIKASMHTSSVCRKEVDRWIRGSISWHT